MRRNGLHQRFGMFVLAALVVTALPAPRAAAAPADDLAAKRAEAAELADQLAGLSEQVSRLTEEYNAARVSADAAQADADVARDALRRTERKHAAAEERLRAQAVQAYVGGGAVSLASAAAAPDATVSQAQLRRLYVRQVLRRQQDAIDALKEAKQQLDARRRSLADVQARWRDALDDLEARRSDATAAVDAQRRALSRAQGELAALVDAEARRRQADEARRATAALAERRAREEAARRASSPTSSPSRSSGSPTTVRPTTPAPPPADGAAAAVAEARRQIGKPYEWGGSGPDTFDCSGLTAWAWRAGGQTLSHSSRAQYGETARVAIADLRPGDLLFYGSPIHHVGIYVGDGKMIEASETGTPVRYASITRSDFAGAGRVT